MATPGDICVYPLSSTYLPFHRYLYYASILIAVLYPTPPPLIKGAFAFSLTYSSTAALYAILIIALPRTQIVNLDIFGLWTVLSTASILVLPLLIWTKNVRSNARPILRLWGALVIIATIITYVLLGRWKRVIEEAVGEQSETQNCAFNSTLPRLKLRNPDEALTTASEPVFGYFYDLIVSRVAGLVLMPVAFGLITCALTIVDTPAYKTQRITPYASHYPYDQRPIVGNVSPDGFSVFSAAKNGFILLRKIILALTPLLFVPTLVINEMYLLKDGKGIPGTEKMYEVGQWGLFVGAGLVAAAALISSIAGKTKKRADEFGLDVGVTGVSLGDGIIK